MGQNLESHALNLPHQPSQFAFQNQNRLVEHIMRKLAEKNLALF
jgi:hypothetical protein